MIVELNAGNIFDDNYLNTVIKWNKEFEGTTQVTSLFGSISGLTPTARASDRLPYMGWSSLDKYVDKARSADIHTRYTLNASCLGSLQDFKEAWDHKLKEDCQELHNIGVDQWTVTSPLLVELLREMFSEDLIEVSTICEVSTPEEVLRWKDLGANAVCLSTSINRDFGTLKNISAIPGVVYSLLSNEACLYKCPYRRECYNLSSHNSKRSEELFSFYPFRRCNEYRIAHPEEWIKARLILPQWMKRYYDYTGILNYKIAFRTHPIETALPMLKHYLDQDFHGNLLDLWPSIAHLGHTDEPKDKTYIDVDKLERIDFLGHFKEEGHVCGTIPCSECKYCDIIYGRSNK